MYIYDHIWLNCFLEWKIFPTKVIEKINTHILCSIDFFQIWCPLWDKVKNIVQPDMPQTAIWQMFVACCITKATNTLRMCNTCWHVSMLRYMYTACLVVVCLNSFLLVSWKCVGMWTVMVEFLETSNCDVCLKVPDSRLEYCMLISQYETIPRNIWRDMKPLW